MHFGNIIPSTRETEMSTQTEVNQIVIAANELHQQATARVSARAGEIEAAEGSFSWGDPRLADCQAEEAKAAAFAAAVSEAAAALTSR
jgi:hypothetical protein